MLSSCDDGLVSVVVAEVDIGFLLKCGIEVTVVDAQSNEFDVLAFDRALGNGSVLGLKIRCELRAVMSACFKLRVRIFAFLGFWGCRTDPKILSGDEMASELLGNVWIGHK